MAGPFNTFQYNQSQFNALGSIEVSKNLDIRYSVLPLVSIDLDIYYDIPLEVNLDLLFSVYETVSADLDIFFDVGDGPFEVPVFLDFYYDVEELIITDLDIYYNVDAELNFDIRYDVGEWVSADLDFYYNVQELVTQNLDIRFDVDDVVEVASNLDIRFDVRRIIPSGGVVIDVDLDDRIGGIRRPDSFPGVEFPPISVCETDGYGKVSVIPCESQKSISTNALSFATQIFVISNQCSMTFADRMLRLVPSEIKELAWNAEFIKKQGSPSRYAFNNLEGREEFAILRPPGSLDQIKDIEIWVSGLGPREEILPANQKAIYLRHDQYTETYIGDTTQLMASIAAFSELVYIDTEEAKVTRAVSATDNFIGLENTSSLPDYGILVLDQEVIKYGSKDAQGVYGIIRGYYDTVVSNHLVGTRAIPCSPLEGNKIVNTRRSALLNSSNSVHMSLWKALGALLCLLWAMFYENINSFSIRLAKLKYLKKIAADLKTSLWHMLKWQRVRGSLSRSYAITARTPDSHDAIMPITKATYDAFVAADLAHQFKNPDAKNARIGMVRVDKEYMLFDYIGHKTDLPGWNPNYCTIGSTHVNCTDAVQYIIRNRERGVQYGGDSSDIEAHGNGAGLEYIPTDFHFTGGDSHLITGSKQEQPFVFRDRLRHIQGEKTNFPSFREMYDNLEQIVPDSKIEIWDFYSTVDNDPSDENRQYVIVEDEIGWYLGVPGRTEISDTTYLGFGLYTNGYWQYLRDNNQAQYEPVKGRYPFFVRTKRWWFDPELLYQMTDRFKSAGTTPNYAINVELETFDTEIVPQEDYSDLQPLAFAEHTNLFRNVEFEDGIVYDYPTHDILGIDDGDYVWRGLNLTMTPRHITAPEYTDIFGTKLHDPYTGLGLKVTTEGSIGVLYQYVDCDSTKDMFVQFVVRSDSDPSGDILPWKSGAVLGSVLTNVIDIGNDWYVLSFVIPKSTFTSSSSFRIGVRIAANSTFIFGSAIAAQATDLVGLVQTGINDNTEKVLSFQSGINLPSSGVLRVGDGVTFEYVKYLSFDSTNDRVTRMARGFGGSSAIAHSMSDDVGLAMIMNNQTTANIFFKYSVVRQQVSVNLDITYNVIA